MSKSKKERQQEKKELRQAQEKAQPKQPQAEKKPEPKPVEAKNAQPETAADVKMNFYSGMSMIMTIMAAASAEDFIIFCRLCMMRRRPISCF